MPAPFRLVSVVDEDETLREAVCRAIRLENHRAVAFADCASAWEAFSKVAPDCAVISMGVIGGDGADLCRRLRQRAAAVPIIAVVRNENDMDRVLSLNPGADDYLPKPFSIKELMPRLQALIRRAGLTGAEVLAWEDRPITLGPLTVDPLRLSARWNDTDVGLSVTEFLVLQALVRRAGVMKTRDQLLQDVFPGRLSTADSIIDRVVARIQQKFEKIEAGFDNVEVVHGAGFRYRAARRRT